MPNSLENQFISDGYVGQLHLGLSALSTGEQRPVYDGLGNQTSLSISQTNSGATVTGALTAGNITLPTSVTPKTLVDFFYPVGSVFISFASDNPGTRFVGTTWSQVSQGKYLVGVGTGVDGNNNSATFTAGNNNSGSYSQTLTNDQVPDHFHYIAVNQTSFANGFNANLDSNSYLAWERNPAGTGSFEYRLDGLAATANVGRTSGVVRTAAVSGVSTTNPSYGLYVWQRTA